MKSCRTYDEAAKQIKNISSFYLTNRGRVCMRAERPRHGYVVWSRNSWSTPTPIFVALYSQAQPTKNCTPISVFLSTPAIDGIPRRRRNVALDAFNVHFALAEHYSYCAPDMLYRIAGEVLSQNATPVEIKQKYVGDLAVLAAQEQRDVLERFLRKQTNKTACKHYDRYCAAQIITAVYGNKCWRDTASNALT